MGVYMWLRYFVKIATGHLQPLHAMLFTQKFTQLCTHRRVTHARSCLRRSPLTCSSVEKEAKVGLRPSLPLSVPQEANPISCCSLRTEGARRKRQEIASTAAALDRRTDRMDDGVPRSSAWRHRFRCGGNLHRVLLAFLPRSPLPPRHAPPACGGRKVHDDRQTARHSR